MKKLVLFDWNGTLLNDIPRWHEATEATFRRFNAQAPSIADFFRELEGDYLDIYRSRGITESRAQLNLIYEAFYNFYSTEATLSPNAVYTLEALRTLEIPCGLVTMQKEELVEPFMAREAIGGFFSYARYHVLNKTDVIREILDEAGVDARDCLFVGDSPSDIRNANDAAVTSVAYMDEHVPNDLIAMANPDFAIRNLLDLVQLAQYGQYPGQLCDGCNVRGFHEHRCHQGASHIIVFGEPAGSLCSCQTCRSGDVIFES